MEPPPTGTPVPPGYHLAYFTPVALSGELGEDGTDTRYNPRKPFTRRMWAGGELRWEKHNPLLVGQHVTETTELLSGDAKVNRLGEEMIVVHVQKTYENDNGLAMTDKRDWVFRKALLKPPPIPDDLLSDEIPFPEPTSAETRSRDFLQTPVALFRFSALTFNAHKIHYSRPWCREVEGHRDIVVHGPLNLINMLDLWRDCQAEGAHNVPRSIKYRAIAPFYANERYRALLERRDEQASNSGEVSDIKMWGNDGQGGVKVGMVGDVVAFTESSSVLYEDR